jgi:cellulose synthase/poly-beta-1,6-N-acetylglucosamine synthase-like glycosyltransferase
MIDLMQYIFWISLILIVYTYFLYPVILKSLNWKRSTEVTGKESMELPRVSVILSVYNESKVLQRKLDNLSALEYPAGKIEVVIGSDGSVDDTNKILKNSSLTNLRYSIIERRRGKAAVLNDLVNISTGDILIFTDANTIFQNDAIVKLVKHFGDKSIGGVCGNLKLSSDGLPREEFGEPWYWSYENSIKKMESDFYTVAGASGGIYAIRKILFSPVPVNKAIVDDFLIPLQAVKKGYRVIYEPRARAFEQATGSVINEFKRKVRIGASNFSTIAEYKSLLDPKKGFIAFALWSHKIIRWFVPFFLLIFFISSAWLSSYSGFYELIFIGGLLFLFLGIFGLIGEIFHVSTGIFGLPYYFLAMNFALLIGFIRFLFGKQKPTWDVIR